MNLRNTGGVIVRDITDLNNPVTRCVLTGGGTFRFISGTRVSYITTGENGDGGMYMIDLTTRTTSPVRVWTNGGSLYWVYDWSPDGNTLSYLSSNADQVEWHVLSAAGDVTLSKLGSVPGRGVAPNTDDAMVGFSADGKYVALENTFSNAAGPAAPFQVVRLSDHKLVYSRKDGTMAVWSAVGAQLYFRTTSGVEVWDEAHGVQQFVAGLSWIHPSPSANADVFSYSTVQPNGNHFAWVVQRLSPTAMPLSPLPRSGAAFLTPTLVWYAEESQCSTQCGLGEPKLTGRTYIYDLASLTENESIITALFDSWPPAS